MPRGFFNLASPEAIGVVLFSVAVMAVAFFAVRARRGKRPTPEQLEARRREWLSRYGKLGGGEIIEIQDSTIAYFYDVRGINYTASQDVAAILDRLPPNPWSVIGGVGIRYDARNPANSIVLSETWTGLRQERRNLA